MAKKITKAELVEALYKSRGLTRKDIHECIDVLFEDLKRAMLEGKVVSCLVFSLYPPVAIPLAASLLAKKP